MQEIDFLSEQHSSTSRDYIKRVVEHDKAKCARIATQWGKEYWDGERKHGYGGYTYDGRWNPIAERIAQHYELDEDASILDVGCGKGYLLYEFTQLLPKAEVRGLDISQYALDNAKPEVKGLLDHGHARSLPYEDDRFDLVLSINTVHNLTLPDLFSSLKEIERVGKNSKWINVEAYRDEREKVNLIYWQLTCRQFNTPREWQWIFEHAGYSGDYGFIYFE